MTYTGEESEREWQTDKQSSCVRVSERCARAPPNRAEHIVKVLFGARGFCHSGSVTICQITKIENNFHAQTQVGERDQ